MKISISGGLYAAILGIVGFVMQYMLLPAVLIDRTGQEAWAAVLIGGMYGLCVSLSAVWIACRFPGRDPLEAISRAVGRWVSLPIRLVYITLNIILYAVALHDLQNFVNIMLLPGTPGKVLVGVLALVAFYAVMQGLEPLARLSYASLMLVIVALVLFPFALAREFSILQIDPFLWKGPGGLAGAVVASSSWSGQVIIVLSLLRHLNAKANPYKWTIIGAGGATILLALSMALVSLVFGSVLPGRMLYPGFEIFAIIAISEAIERVQAALMIIWLGGGMTKLSLNLWAAVEEGSLALGVRHRYWIAIAFTVAGLAAAELITGSLERAELTQKPEWILLQVGMQLTVVILLVGAGLFAKLRQQERHHG